mmetsp:Transcript_8196/g.20473  ORF Transcript_8196/g.20473 Transcript_8196/m.20473 type:complete len:217 (+) Transcript_8196:690-1340(+)
MDAWRAERERPMPGEAVDVLDMAVKLNPLHPAPGDPCSREAGIDDGCTCIKPELELPAPVALADATANASLLPNWSPSRLLPSGRVASALEDQTLAEGALGIRDGPGTDWTATGCGSCSCCCGGACTGGAWVRGTGSAVLTTACSAASADTAATSAELPAALAALVTRRDTSSAEAGTTGEGRATGDKAMPACPDTCCRMVAVPVDTAAPLLTAMP